MKAEIFDERDQELEVIKRSSRRTPIPAPADVQHEASVVGQNSLDFPTESEKPVNVSLLAHIPVRFLQLKSVGGDVKSRLTDASGSAFSNSSESPTYAAPSSVV